MKQINLLPYNIIAKEQQTKQLPAFFVVVALAVVSVGGLWSFWKLEKHSADITLARAQESNAKLEAQKNKELADNNKDQAIKQKILKINNYSKQELNWSQVFQNVAQIIPKNASIGTVNYVPGIDGLGVKISGTLPSNVDFAAFVQSLNLNQDLTAQKVDSYVYDPKLGGVTFTVSGKFLFNKLYYPPIP